MKTLLTVIAFARFAADAARRRDVETMKRLLETA